MNSRCGFVDAIVSYHLSIHHNLERRNYKKTINFTTVLHSTTRQGKEGDDSTREGRREDGVNYARAKPYLASIFFLSFSDMPETLFLSFSIAAANAFSVEVSPSAPPSPSTASASSSFSRVFFPFLDFLTGLAGEGSSLCGSSAGGS